MGRGNTKEKTYRGAQFIGQAILGFLPGDQGVVCQVMRETEGFDVFLNARRDDPLVAPELVSLQIRFHRREEVLDLCELRVCDLGDLLAVLSPLVHDTVEEKDELF